MDRAVALILAGLALVAVASLLSGRRRPSPRGPRHRARMPAVPEWHKPVGLN